MAVSWLGIIAIAALFYVVVSGLANPRTRPFVISLGALVGLGVVLLGFLFVGFRTPSTVPVAPRSVTISASRPAIIATAPTPSPPVPIPPSGSAIAETTKPKMSVIVALGQAIVQAWSTRESAPAVRASAKPTKPNPPEVPTQPRVPAWVNAAPKMDDNCYLMSVCVGPFTTPMECERELPKALQGAVGEYAELLVGNEAAGVRLPEDMMQQLVRDRWTEVRSMEIGGSSRDMFSLHVLVGFDVRTRLQLRSESQRLVVGKRVQDAAVVFSGLLGLMAIAWGSLKLVTRRQVVKMTGAT